MTETLEQYRRAERLCLRCGRWDDWTEDGHRLCWRCMAREGEAVTDADRARMRYYERRHNKQCGRCGRQDARTLAGRAYCAECDARRKGLASETWRRSPEVRQRGHDALTAMRARRKAAGLCVVCGRAPARAGKTLCKKCADVQRIRQAAHYKRAKAAGTLDCPYAAGLEDMGEYACLHCPRPNTCIYDVRDRDGD